MTPLDHILDTAQTLGRHIILSEGDDPRIREAARQITARGLAKITLITATPEPGITTIDPALAEDLDDLVVAFHQLREKKGMTLEKAREVMSQPIPQAAMRVRLGQADGTVGGAVATTSDTVRAALQILGRAPGTGIVSSFFFMQPQNAQAGDGMIFSDCGLVIDPDAEELADIAIAAGKSCEQILGEKPRVAMLSFSTAGSATHPSIDKIHEAIRLIRLRQPDLEVDGELQFDAAFDDNVRAKKAPNSVLTARPNVFVFPNLAAGNIGYKIAQRLGGVMAVGPILQGLAKPANDLSRGCNVDDIIAAVAVTALQSK